MQLEILLDYHPADTLTEKHTQWVSADGRLKVILNPANSNQVLAFAEGVSIVSANSFPKSPIKQPCNFGGRKHFLDLIPTP